ncbi:MAG: hypothetical protein AAF212_02900 [Verrucomicrobiota bacterium]
MKYIAHITLATSALFLAACGGGKDSSAAENSEGSAPAENSTSGGSGFSLVTEIPSELIEGTPQPVSVPNLEQVSSVPTLVVPEGTVLLSAGKEVTSSDDFPIIGDLSYITDGDKEAGEGYFVELMDGVQWVQIDLGAPSEVSAVWLWHYHSQKRAYNDVMVQLSNDPEFASGVTTVFNNDYDNSAEIGRGTDRPYVDTRFGKLVDAKGTTAQYVRLYSNGNTANEMNHYIEVEVYGIAP